MGTRNLLVELVLWALLLLTAPRGSIQDVFKVGLAYDYEFNIVIESYDVAKMAVKIINDHSDGILDNLLVGHTLQVVHYNTTCSQGSGLEAGFHFGTVDKVHFIVGAVCSGSTTGMCLMAQEFSVPVVSFLSTSPVLSDHSTYRYFLRTVPNDLIQAQVMVDFVKEMGWGAAIIVAADNVYSKTLFGAVKDSAEANGVKISKSIIFTGGGSLSDPSKEESIRGQIKLLKSASNRIIFWVLGSSDSSAVSRIMFKENYLSTNLVIITSDAFTYEDRDVDTEFGESFIGNIGVIPGAPPSSDLASKLVDKWKIDDVS